eukprot:jgi/Hompol1/3512/HPOL_006578-RA
MASMQTVKPTASPLLPRRLSSSSFFSWSPTSAAKATLSELALLSRYLAVQLAGGPELQQHDRSLAAIIANSSSSSSSSNAADGEAEEFSRPVAELGLVEVEPGQFINTLVVEQVWKRDNQRSIAPSASSTEALLARAPSAASLASVPQKNLVVCHGYGIGLGHFFKNFPILARVPGYQVFAIDWLGMGNSSRTSLPKLGSDASDEEIVETTERYFIDSLEQWRQRMGLEKMVLVGHSMGGYLSTAYALKFPERVEKLILVSPGEA